MSSEHELDRELIWQTDGHLHEVAITALSDGEARLLPDSARIHAATCDACSERLGQAAALSLALDDALEAQTAAYRAVAGRAEQVRRPFPAAAAAAALLLAAIGMLPRFVEMAHTVVELPSFLSRARPVVLESVAALTRSLALHGGPVVFFAWCASLVTLFALGALIARFAPYPTESKGEL